ncbi:MAG: hypothetical protein RLZZ292_3511 [Bacteroidota bacterium]|jgi:hypothetical protein
MKKIILFSFLFALYNNATAQAPSIVAEPSNVITVVVDATAADAEADSKVTNTSNTAKKFKWERTIPCNAPQWSSTVCDKNTCWGPNTSSKTFSLNAGESGILLLHITPDNKKGSAVFNIKVTDLADSTNTTTIKYIFNSDCTVGTHEVNAEIAALTLSPNPATEFIKISPTDLVKHVEIYNILGRKVRSFDYEEGKQYWINDLNQGMYLISLTNENYKPLKTIKLCKK